MAQDDAQESTEAVPIQPHNAATKYFFQTPESPTAGLNTATGASLPNPPPLREHGARKTVRDVLDVLSSGGASLLVRKD